MKPKHLRHTTILIAGIFVCSATATVCLAEEARITSAQSAQHQTSNHQLTPGNISAKAVVNVSLHSELQLLLQPEYPQHSGETTEPAAENSLEFTTENTSPDATPDEPLNTFGGSLVVAIDEDGNRVKPTKEQIEKARQSVGKSKRPAGKPIVSEIQLEDGSTISKMTNLPVYGVYARRTSSGTVEAICFDDPKKAEKWMNEALQENQVTREPAE